METIDKIAESIRWNRKESRFMIFRVTKTYNIDEITQHRLSQHPIAVKEGWYELDCLPEDERLYKKITIPILLMKRVTDRENLELLEGYFSQSLEVSVLSDEVYQHKYLSKSNGRVFVHDLDADWTMPLVFSGGDATSGIQAGIHKKFLGTEKRISVEEAFDMKESGCTIFEKQGNEYSISLGTFKD